MAGDFSQRFMVRRGQIGRVLIGFMAAGFLALIAAGVTAAWVMGELTAHNEAIAHTYRVELTISDNRRLIEQGETTRRGYLLSPQAGAGFLRTYNETAEQLPVAARRLRQLTHDNPHQQLLIRQIEHQVHRLLARRTRTIDLVQRGEVEAARQVFRAEESATELRRIRVLYDAMSRVEQKLLELRDARQERSLRLFYLVLAVAGALLLAVAIASLLVVVRYTADLFASRTALQQLNESLEGIVTERTADLSRANDEIQRFAYIVSHDLRSPLVNVMGFTAELETASHAVRAMIDRAETEAPGLVDEEARLAAREDLPEAIGFIRTSTQKMDRLINAILALSRQGRRVLAPERLDLARIVGAIRDSLAHRLEEEGASVIVEGTLPAIVSDRLAVEQILSNLIENAVKYRQPGRPVTVRVSGGASGGRAWLDVADNGRGIDPRDHERVFDLFRRSGSQDQPGEGIGLAHVRALAYRLGGTIAVRSTLGEGATFRLSLPTTLVLQEKAE